LAHSTTSTIGVSACSVAVVRRSSGLVYSTIVVDVVVATVSALAGASDVVASPEHEAMMDSARRATAARRL